MKTGTQMSRLTRGLVAVALGAGFAGAAVAGISTTKHNLGTGGTAGNNRVTAGTAEICVFCHTPHAADISTIGVPLWNKRLATGVGSFTTYSSSTMDALGASDGQGGGQIGSVSIACLSCHDGTQAMDNMLNAPGSGGYASNGGGPSGTNYTWAAGVRADAAGYLINSGTFIAMLSKDLSNDHPIGMQYCGGGPRVGTPTAACADADFVAPTSGSIGGGTVFWVDTGTGGRQKTDMILYNRGFLVNGSLPAGTYPSVECASCHDVHGGAAGSTFLRISNDNSAVCLACHIK